MCDIARLSETKILQRKKGRPSIDLEIGFEAKSSISTIYFCTSCKSPVGRGLSHKCNVTSLQENISQIFDNADETTQEIIASRVIMKKSREGKNVIKLVTKGHNTLPLQLCDAEKITTTFSTESLNALQISPTPA